jgi:hypothetical protein
VSHLRRCDTAEPAPAAGGGGGALSKSDTGCSLSEMSREAVAATLSALPTPLHIVQFCDVDLADAHVGDAMHSLVFQSVVDPDSGAAGGAAPKHVQTIPRDVRYARTRWPAADAAATAHVPHSCAAAAAARASARRLPLSGALERWHVPPADELHKAVRVAVYVVDVSDAAHARDDYHSYCLKPEPLCTVKTQQVSVQPGADGVRELSVHFYSNELKKSCQEGGCPFVLSVGVSARPGVTVHLVTLPFFVNWKEPKRAQVKGPQIRSASRFVPLRGTQEQLNLGLPSGGSLGPARRWPDQLTPPQRTLIVSALSRDATVSIVDFAINHAAAAAAAGDGSGGGGGGGVDEVNPFAVMSRSGAGTPHEALAVKILDLCRSTPDTSERVMAGLEAVYASLQAEASAQLDASIETRNIVTAAAETLSQLSQFSQGSIRSFAIGGGGGAGGCDDGDEYER